MGEQRYARRLAELRHVIDLHLRGSLSRGRPRQLNEACRYVLGGGGKRLRAVLVVVACRAVGGRTAQALDAACAVEIMHNFTLVHDDIMDSAATRRGRPRIAARRPWPSVSWYRTRISISCFSGIAGSVMGVVRSND